MTQILSSVTLTGFRSYKESSFEFDQGVNIIIGQNAVGKTNLLEAVYLACFGKGFRTSSDGELINSDSTWSRVETMFGSVPRVVKLQKDGGERLKKSFEIGGRKKARLLFEDIIPIVLFQPDDLRLSAGGPNRRRDYLDGLLTQLSADYRSDLLAYERALKQRNTLLKSGNAANAVMFAWNVQLAERGGRIAEKRFELVERLSNQLSDIYSLVAGAKYDIEMVYHSLLPRGNYTSKMLNGLEQNFARDMMRGYTSLGPHRDDILLLINGKPMKEVASRGENRTLLLALKILELKEVEARRGTRPLLLLDDVFSELDGSRRRLLTEFLNNHQTLITTTDADVVSKDFSRHARLLGI